VAHQLGPAAVGRRRRVRVVDGSVITEPGATGSTWRLHYSISLPSLQCDEVEVTGPEIGESCQRYTVRPGDLLIGDRGLAQRPGIRYVVGAGGAVIVPLNLTNVPLVDAAGQRLALLARLRQLSAAAVGDWPAAMTDKWGRLAGRVCAIKKSPQAARQARQRARRQGAKAGRAVKAEPLEAAGYLLVFTTLSAAPATLAAVLEMYRGR
jgi:hypothetical protein